MAKETAAEMKFTKQQWAESKKYRHQPDLISALLEDDKSYTGKQVEKILADYLNKEVR